MPILSAMEFQVVVKNGSHILNPRHTKVAGLIKACKNVANTAATMFQCISLRTHMSPGESSAYRREPDTCWCLSN